AYQSCREYLALAVVCEAGDVAAARRATTPNRPPLLFDPGGQPANNPTPPGGQPAPRRGRPTPERGRSGPERGFFQTPHVAIRCCNQPLHLVVLGLTLASE